ncbi:MAG: S1/P1 nuclease [Fimbriimonas sp.]
MVRKFQKRASLLALLLCLTPNAFAWTDFGHRTIAEIANMNLTPEARAEVKRLLGTMSIGEASVWADNVRRDRPNTGPWHYKDFFFRPDRKRTANKPGEENAVWAIRKYSAILADRSQSDAVRSEALKWVLHFVGDIHQPLHAVSRETDALPKGDRGGNDFKILAPREMSNMQRPPTNLHALWDLGCGLFTGEGSPVQVAQTIEAAVPFAGLRGGRNLNPEDWAKESFGFAKSSSYSTEEGKEPTPEYLRASRQIITRRVAIAGYRLAQTLNKSLKPAR